MTGGTAGRLLVATPLLVEDTFARTVVLMLDHNDEGALGVVVNRPTDVPVGDVLPDWRDVVVAPDVLFQGGPVSLDSALGLVALRDGTGPPAGASSGPSSARLEAGPGDAGDEPIGVKRIRGRLGLVDLDTPPDVVAGALAAMRVFAGYAGWAPGQLEAELAQQAWVVVDAEPADAFSPEPALLWRQVLRRQPGPLSWLATYPADATLN